MDFLVNVCSPIFRERLTPFDHEFYEPASVFLIRWTRHQGPNGVHVKVQFSCCWYSMTLQPSFAVLERVVPTEERLQCRKVAAKSRCYGGLTVSHKQDIWCCVYLWAKDCDMCKELMMCRCQLPFVKQVGEWYDRSTFKVCLPKQKN